jgi:hypothetical protein
MVNRWGGLDRFARSGGASAVGWRVYRGCANWGQEKFRMQVEKMDEYCDAGMELVANPLFTRLGLADAAIAKVCARGILVFT